MTESTEYTDDTERRFDCECGERHEVYEAYRTCPHFRTKVDILAGKEGVEPIHILSTGKWTKPVSDAEIGLVE